MDLILLLIHIRIIYKLENVKNTKNIWHRPCPQGVFNLVGKQNNVKHTDRSSSEIRCV